MNVVMLPFMYQIMYFFGTVELHSIGMDLTTLIYLTMEENSMIGINKDIMALKKRYSGNLI